MVNIQHRQQQLAAVTLPARHFQLQALTPASTIGQPGERVDQGFLPLLFKMIAEVLCFLLHLSNFLCQCPQALGHLVIMAFTLPLMLGNGIQQAIETRFQGLFQTFQISRFLDAGLQTTDLFAQLLIEAARAFD